jgi:hypothetical protein
MEAAERLRLQPVDLSGHDEVALGQAVDLVGPERDLGLTPGQQNVGMMALFLSQRAHAVHEVERILEVGKSESASDVVLVDHSPLGDDFVQRVEFLALERWHSAPAGNTFFVG